MIKKYLLCPQRVRKPPKQFSWLDQRLVREGHIEKCSHQALALYLFLVIVGDAQGLSYYADATISKRLGMPLLTLETARQNLIQESLIAYAKPLYQVLDVPAPVINDARRPGTGPMSIGQIFQQLSKEHHHDRL